MPEAEPKEEVKEAKPFKEPLSRRLTRSLWKTLCLLLLLALVVCIALWRPWEANAKASDRTISVSGTATVTAVPDEFVFYPSYEFTNPDKQAALAEISKKSDEITSKLKSLGVADNKIKTDSDSYNKTLIAPAPSTTGESVYSLRLTVTVNNKAQAQKVQDYLITTSPSGTISPSSTFSKDKQKSLESQARGKAETDARVRAEQSAKNLGFKVGSVKALQDGGFGGGGCRGDICASGRELTLDAKASTTSSQSLAVQPGENELSYSITVVYYIN